MEVIVIEDRNNIIKILMLPSLFYDGFTPEQHKQSFKVVTGSFDDNWHLSVQAIFGDKLNKGPKSLTIDDNGTIVLKNSNIQANKVIGEVLVGGQTFSVGKVA